MSFRLSQRGKESAWFWFSYRGGVWRHRQRVVEQSVLQATGRVWLATVEIKFVKLASRGGGHGDTEQKRSASIQERTISSAIYRDPSSTGVQSTAKLTLGRGAKGGRSSSQRNGNASRSGTIGRGDEISKNPSPHAGLSKGCTNRRYSGDARSKSNDARATARGGNSGLQGAD